MGIMLAERQSAPLLKTFRTEVDASWVVTEDPEPGLSTVWPDEGPEV